MLPIVHRCRTLAAAPRAFAVAGVTIRQFQGENDIATWLALRERCFARERVGVGSWNPADFQREFLDKPWWRPDWMWFAETKTRLLASPTVIGTVTLAMRGFGSDAKAVVHWLCVLPTHRRLGVASLLMNQLELAAWNAEYRQISLETHAAWSNAAGFYDRLGYRPIDAG